MAERSRILSSRKSLLGLLLGVLLVWSLPACNSDGEPVFMWQVKGENATVTMLGSIHVGKPEFFPLAAPMETAFAAAPVLAVEMDMTDPAIISEIGMLMMQEGMLPEGQTLNDRLEPETMARLEEFAAERQIPLAMYQKFKPGIVAMVLVMEEYQRQGFDPELGIDKHFLDQAREQGKEIISLETARAQLDLFTQISDQLDDVLLNEMLDQMADVAAMTEQMIALWQAGDAAGLDKFMQDQMGEDPEMVAFYRRLLDDRNVKMAEAIDEMLAGDQDVFLVVGAAHFAGDMGLVSLLQAKGRQVEQVHVQLQPAGE